MRVWGPLPHLPPTASTQRNESEVSFTASLFPLGVSLDLQYLLVVAHRGKACSSELMALNQQPVQCWWRQQRYVAAVSLSNEANKVPFPIE